MKKFFKRVVVGVAALAVLCSVPLMSSCETSHPEAEITISYNGEEYVLKYKLYRNMYPQTVRHFIELADAGFYDNTIIHDYSGSYMYGGGYSYSGSDDTQYESNYETDYEEGQEAMREYFENTSKEAQYYELFTNGAFTYSVYRDYINGEYVDPLPTVIGEVGETHVILHGALSGGFGALRMYYSDKELDVGDEVYLDKDNNEDGTLLASYLEHSATSIFSIQTTTSGGTEDYCIFGELIDTDPLTELYEEISEDDTLSVSNVEIDLYDEIISDRYTNKTSYTVTSIPIIVTSVRITKY